MERINSQIKEQGILASKKNLSGHRDFLKNGTVPRKTGRMENLRTYHEA